MSEATLETKPVEDEAARPLLHIQNAMVAYGQSVVVEGVNLNVPEGSIISILGRNGVGKSTLMKAIIGTLPLRWGSISLRDREIQQWPPYRRARAGIGYVPQGRAIFPYMTVMENLLIGLEAVRGEDTGQIEEVLEMFPVLRSMAGRQAGLLSGGQQQQLAIGRALAGRPKLLLLDEPTEGIQPSIVEMIEGVVASFRGKLSVLLVEQFLDFALAVSDHCYVMEQGRMVLDGSPANLDESQLRRYLSV